MTSSQVSLTGDVTGTATFNEGKYTINTQRRGCLVGGTDSDNNAKNFPWYKFASISIPKIPSMSYLDEQIVFMVNTNHNSNSAKGILSASFRTRASDSENFFVTADLRWLVCGYQINPSNFVLAYKESDNALDVELWVKIDTLYWTHEFSVLAEGIRQNRKSSWTLYDNFATAGVESVTKDFILIESSVMMTNARTVLQGTTDISAIADGTITGSINQLARSEITLTGDVTGAATFNNGKYEITTNKRGCMVGSYAHDPSSRPWFKFASISLSGTWFDRDIVFMVTSPYEDNVEMGILKAAVRSGNTVGTISSGGLKWLITGDNINPNNFVFAYARNGASLEVELWAKISEIYRTYSFTVLSEGDRVSRGIYWTLYSGLDESAAHDSPTEGYTQKASLPENLNGLLGGTGRDILSVSDLNAVFEQQDAHTLMIVRYQSSARNTPKQSEGLCFSFRNNSSVFGVQFVVSDAGMYRRTTTPENGFSAWVRVTESLTL